MLSNTSLQRRWFGSGDAASRGGCCTSSAKDAARCSSWVIDRVRSRASMERAIGVGSCMVIQLALQRKLVVQNERECHLLTVYAI